MTKAEQRLEHAAIRAHRDGVPWADFWQQHGGEVCRAEPHNRQRFQRLVRRLLALVTSGDTDGQEPISTGCLWGEAWNVDDTQEAST